MEERLLRLDGTKRRSIKGLILAAGLSSRMGDFKPLLPLRGKTVIENAVDSLLSAGAEQIVVVLGHRAQEVETLLRSRYADGTLLFARNERYAETDMLASVKEGLALLPPCDAFFLLPGDMPVIGQETYLAVRHAMPEHGAAIVFPTLAGYRKHPPLIDGSFIPAILHYEGTEGLRGFWRLHEESIVTVAVDDPGCCTDLDTRQQYEHCISTFR